MSEAVEINNPEVSIARTRLIQIKGGKVKYGQVLVLDNVDFEVSSGDFIYIIGKTGTGKTSLLKILYGDLEFNDGEGTVCGYNLKTLKRDAVPLLRRRLGIVFQDYKLLKDRTIYENLEYVLHATGWKDKQKIKTKIQEATAMVGLESKLNNFPGQLSGGEQQRIGIARALLNSPEIIIADEPTGNLDFETTEEIMNLLYNIHKTTKTPVIIATHNYSLIENYPGIIYMCAYQNINRDDSHNQQ